jgi:uncharacterized protein
MASPMLKSATPKDLADRSYTIEKPGKIDDFDRLVEVIEKDLEDQGKQDLPQTWRQAPVDIKLRFGFSAAWPGIPSLEGELSTTVAAVCQRCLEPFDMALKTDVRLLFPRRDVSVNSGEEYEVWELDEDTVTPAEIVEEALIMAMPFSTLHASSKDCSMWPEESEEDTPDKVRPFADLKSLLSGNEETN